MLTGIYIYLILLAENRLFFPQLQKSDRKLFVSLKTQPDFVDQPCYTLFVRAKQKKISPGLFLNGCIANLFDQCFEYYAAHPFNKLDAANDKVPATGNTSTRDLIVQFPYHTRDVHVHTPGS
jgi:hypothetical protein